MIKRVYFTITFFLCLLSQVNAQYFDSSQIANVNSTRQASEGDLYQDTVKGSYFIGLSTGELSQINFNPDSTASGTFAIWAEKASTLTSNTFQWSYGNGDASQAGFGIVVPENCELYAVGLSLNDGSAEVEVYLNGIASGILSGVAGAGPSNAALYRLDTARYIPAGTVVNFRTITAGGANDGGKAVAWFRLISKPIQFKKLNGIGAPTTGLGNNGDEYLNTSNGDVYVKRQSVWKFSINIKGSKGYSSSRGFIQMTNLLSGDINNGTTQFSWLDTTSSKVIQDESSTFTKGVSGVTVSKTGLYKVSIFQYQVTQVERSNAAVRISINGTAQSGYGANAYIRTGSGHEESTASIEKIVSVTAGQEIGIINEQLALAGSVICPGRSLIFIVEEIL